MAQAIEGGRVEAGVPQPGVGNKENSAMRGFWITDMSMLLDDDGNIRKSGGGALEMAGFLQAIIIAMDRESGEGPRDTGVPCRNASGPERCQGRIRGVNLLDDPNRIFWECPVCEDAGEVFNFRGTIWDPRHKLVRLAIEKLIHDSKTDPDQDGRPDRGRADEAEG